MVPQSSSLPSSTADPIKHQVRVGNTTREEKSVWSLGHLVPCTAPSLENCSPPKSCSQMNEDARNRYDSLARLTTFLEFQTHFLWTVAQVRKDSAKPRVVMSNASQGVIPKFGVLIFWTFLTVLTETLPVCFGVRQRFWTQSRTAELSFVLEGSKVLIIELAFCFTECTSWHRLGNVSASSLKASAFFRCLTLIFDLASRIQTALGTLTAEWWKQTLAALLSSLLFLVFILKPGLPYFWLTQLPLVTNFTLHAVLVWLYFFNWCH